jgi:hypothetical protein
MTVAKDASIKSFSKDFGNEKQATDALDIKAEEITLLPPRSDYNVAECVGPKVHRPVGQISDLLTKSTSRNEANTHVNHREGTVVKNASH